MQEQKIAPDNFKESDIGKISEQVERLKNTPEFQNVPHEQIVKESIKQAYPQMSQPQATSQVVLDHKEDDLLPDYMKNAPQEEKDVVESLIHIAFADGIEASINEARKIKNPRILDDLHDALTDKVISQLEKK